MPPRTTTVPYLLAGAFHRMAVTHWGDPDAPPVVCVHGLTRNGADFDILAEALSDRFHVICPDLPGRGASDWLADPMLYQAQHYVAALAHLLTSIGRDVAWIGTSLGGICGILLAATPGTPVNRLILNDIGPFIPAEALGRIRDYLLAATDSPVADSPGADSPEAGRFADLPAVERHLRLVHAPFGELTDAQWARLTRSSSREREGGGFAMHYDPRIVEPMRDHAPSDVDLWPFWARIRVPVLAIRGKSSDILLPATLERMRETGAATHVVANAGHAPALMDAAQIAVVRDFLNG